MRLGFPRALMYYEYYPFWAGFFYKLGIELVTSPLTNREIMESGLKKAPDETCLPVKILVGHLTVLSDVDGIFLPRLVSMEKNTYLCPKILGLPESVLYALPAGVQLYTVDINWREGKREVLKQLMAFGGTLRATKGRIREAFAEAQRWQKAYQRMRHSGWSFTESMQCFEALAEPMKLKDLGFKQVGRRQKPEDFEDGWLLDQAVRSGCREKGPKIALVGHSYLTYESYANMNLLQRLREKAQVVVVENIGPSPVEEQHSKLQKKIFWSHAKKIFGAGAVYVEDPEIEGLIYLSCFGCGTDSMTNDLLARRARQNQKPYVVLTLDEHSGEAGVVTRIEAFLDMLERRRDYESHLSSYGERLDRDSSLT
ncbi:acyl-CoA dehydratase activase-related protein [Desulfitobacterium hafniense]|nr:acyl-CoA dehydratase activase-related protein [Desulfitobacterium hafniense]